MVLVILHFHVEQHSQWQYTETAHLERPVHANFHQFPSIIRYIVDLLRRKNEREMPEEAFWHSPQKPESIICSFACGFQCIQFQATQGAYKIFRVLELADLSLSNEQAQESRRMITL